MEAGTEPVVITWTGHPVATLTSGPALAIPRIKLDRALDALTKADRDRVADRLTRWLAALVAKRAPALAMLADAARDPAATPAFRAVAAAVEGTGGIAPRLPLRPQLDLLSPDERRRLRKLGITVGALDLFEPRLLKPAAATLRRALLAVRGQAPDLPPDGAAVLPRGAPGAALASGFRPLGAQSVRVDLVERIARAAHDARQGRTPFAPDPALATSMGLEPGTLARLMAELGFHQKEEGRWVWRGRPPARPVPAAARPDNAFSGLSALFGHG